MSTAVTALPRRRPDVPRPLHWADDKHSKFVNPWDSWHDYPAVRRIVPYVIHVSQPSTRPDSVQLPRIQPPKWETYQQKEIKDKIKSTWLGHACFLVELPAKPSEPRGVRILFDPVFSERCSFTPFVGPKRFTPAPCDVEQIQDIDAVVISHNHYDHMDANTLQTIYKRLRKPEIFAPLGNDKFLKSLRIPESSIHIMDWWESKRVKIPLPLIPSQTDSQSPNATLSFDITCTPCQHFSGRWLTDANASLWSSWAIESLSSDSEEKMPQSVEADQTQPSRKGVKVFFGGDTGYRSVPNDTDEDAVPKCPVFKEIGEEFGGFDFAMIPIGAYQPREVMSPIHCAPQDSVCLFKDIRARKALGMHWGTWILTTEPVEEPPKKLAEECQKAGIPEGDFGVCDIGETRFW